MIKVAHSPDNDDHFFFWPIKKALIDLSGLSFSLEQFHTEELNSLAETAAYDVVAISTAAYPRIADKYLILTSGASVGRNYGPVLVAKKAYAPEDFNSLRIAVPGLNTTAALILAHLAPTAEMVEIPIVPHNAVFSALDQNSVDAAVLIHEGQICYEERGLVLAADLGKWWNTQTGLPLVLGVNVIGRHLGSRQIAAVSQVLHRAIAHALNNSADACDYLQQLDMEVKLDRTRLRQYLAMYANADSLSLADDAKAGIQALLPNIKLAFASV